MRLQKIFDTCASHLLKQGKQCLDDRGGCIYLGPEGLMCGAAPVLNREWMERNKGEMVVCEGERCIPANYAAIRNLIHQYPTSLKEEFANLNKWELTLIDDIQSVHDNSPVSSWYGELEFLAGEYSLSTTILEGK